MVHIIFNMDDNNVSNKVCNAEVSLPREGSQLQRSDSRKRLRHENNGGSPVKFRGVVPQQNGNWGAQIYANHQRIWLGTFRTEKEAAMAYDSASLKLRRGDSQRNFPWTSHTLQEPKFQSSFSSELILDMIRDGTYQSKFMAFLKNRSKNEGAGISLDLRRLNSDGQLSYRQLFQKELTPSDVGKLNRLVIPKKYAVKHFPLIKENSGDESCKENNDGAIDDVEVVIYDKQMKAWKFRYCYWKSSQSFVFTRGWNRFVKEKNLKAKDIITFYACEQHEANRVKEKEKEKETFCLIDVHYHSSSNNSSDSQGSVGIERLMRKDVEIGEDEEMKLHYEVSSSYNVKDANGNYQECKKDKLEESGFKLFGVKIR